MTIEAHTNDARQEADAAIAEWARKWVELRAQKASEIQADPEFQAWAAQQIARGRWNMDDCVTGVMTRTEDWVPPFPWEAVPAWVDSIDASGDGFGGETTVLLYGVDHQYGETRARLSWGLYVVVGDNADGKPVGAWSGFSNGVCVLATALPEELTAQQAFDAARALSAASAELEEVLS